MPAQTIMHESFLKLFEQFRKNSTMSCHSNADSNTVKIHYQPVCYGGDSVVFLIDCDENLNIPRQGSA
jgi:hypothetical protein